MFDKLIVVDTRGHLLGRLASLIAKELLCGQHVVCVRCEEINISGTFMRNKRAPRSATILFLSPSVPLRAIPPSLCRPHWRACKAGITPVSCPSSPFLSAQLSLPALCSEIRLLPPQAHQHQPEVRPDSLPLPRQDFVAHGSRDASTQDCEGAGRAGAVEGF